VPLVLVVSRRLQRRPTPVRWALATMVVLSVLASCSPRTGGSARPRPQEDVTRSELERVFSESAYGAIRQLRPSWLFYRLTPTPTNPNPEPAVYVDRARLRRLDDLHTVPVEDVERIQFLNASDATTRFGIGHMHGAIIVITRYPGA